MILVDQFEEFFTTQENYVKGVPSQDSQVTMNVILETAKIALKEGIPIYVICTMRSDFIGQCASFRGLPESIGFSQFFVPRLKRDQLRRVIAEPARLSGSTISSRLVERLIYDLSEGIDQLPILQHALSQIWRMADQEDEEMDLIHYAMVGGMPANELPDEDQSRFLSWYKKLPEYQRKSYKTTSLDNVLDIHANRLYESAASEYNRRYPDNPIAIGAAKRSVALTFACLTRIDEGRGVRNRMTLGEITDIINNPDLDHVSLGRLLSIFRQEGNTFIRPFIFDEDEVQDLDRDVVMDITHESLIRNWQRLKNWAWKESEYYETFIDFKKQLDRWVSHSKSGNFLLPVGPLGFFEKWYEECKPNAHWINRYQDQVEDKDASLKQSAEILEQSKTFLKKSANKHFLAKLFMTYGARNIAIGVAILSTILLSSFYYTDAVKKQNDNVINEVYRIAEEYINNDDLLLNFNESKAWWLRSALIHDPQRAIEIIQNIEPERVKVEVPIETYSELLIFEPGFIGFEKDSIINTILRNMSEVYAGDALSLGEKLKNANQFAFLLGHDVLFTPTDDLTPAIQDVTKVTYDLLTVLLNASPSEEADISSSVYYGVQNVNNLSRERVPQIKTLLPLVSPFTETGKTNFDHYFPRNSTKTNGADQLTHNGGYQLLAEMYAAIGDGDNMYRSLNKVLETNDVLKYSNQESFNGIYQVFGYLLIGGYDELLTEFIDYVESTFSIAKVDFLELFVDRAGHYKYFNGTNFIEEHQNHAGKLNPVLSSIGPELMDKFFQLANQIIAKEESLNTQRFYEALFLKYQALITHRYLADKKLDVPTEQLDRTLIKAFEALDKVNETLLDREIEITYRYYSDGIRRTMMSNRKRFLYPDIFARSYQGNKYLSGYFVGFLERNPSFQEYYNSAAHQDLIIDWVFNAYEVHLFIEDVERIEIDLTLDELTFVYQFLSQSPYVNELDLNLINLLISNKNFALGNLKKAYEHFENFNEDRIGNSASRVDYLNATFLYNQIVELCSHLAIDGKRDDVDRLIGLIDQDHFKIKSYLLIAKKVHSSDSPEYAYYYIDKAYYHLDRLDPSQGNVSFWYNDNIIETLAEIGSRELDLLIDDQLRDQYPGGTAEKSIGLVKRGKYFQALQTMPQSNTMMQDLNDMEVFLIFSNDNINLPKWSRTKSILDRYGLVGNDYVRFVTN